MSEVCFLKDGQVVCSIKIQGWLFLVKNKCNAMLMVANYPLFWRLEICRAGGVLLVLALWGS